MKLSRRVAAVAVTFSFLLSLPGVGRAADGHEVSGSYSVQSATGAGTNVQVMLHVRLSNSQDNSLQTTQVALRSIVTDATQNLDVSIDLPAQGSADFTQQVTITKSEYALWQRGARPLLVLNLQSADGTRFTRTIALTPGAPAEGN